MPIVAAAVRGVLVGGEAGFCKSALALNERHSEAIEPT
jgi:hypothetical protein